MSWSGAWAGGWSGPWLGDGGIAPPGPVYVDAALQASGTSYAQFRAGFLVLAGLQADGTSSATLAARRSVQAALQAVGVGVVVELAARFGVTYPLAGIPQPFPEPGLPDWPITDAQGWPLTAEQFYALAGIEQPYPALPEQDFPIDGPQPYPLLTPQTYPLQ